MKKNRSTFSILFYLNRSKMKKSGKCPIVSRISVDGKSTTFSTGLEVLPEYWDVKLGLATGKPKEIDNINRQIESYRNEITNHYKDMVNNNGYVTAAEKGKMKDTMERAKLKSELDNLQRLVDRIPPDILAELKRQQRQHGKER